MGGLVGGLVGGLTRGPRIVKFSFSERPAMTTISWSGIGSGGGSGEHWETARVMCGMRGLRSYWEGSHWEGGHWEGVIGRQCVYEGRRQFQEVRSL